MCSRLGAGNRHVVRPEYDVMCLGFEGAGKSSLLALASKEETDDIAPTKGKEIWHLFTMARCVLLVSVLWQKPLSLPVFKLTHLLSR